MTNEELRMAIAQAKGMILDGVNWQNEPMWRHHQGAELEMVPNWTEDIGAAWTLAEEATIAVIPVKDNYSQISGYIAGADEGVTTSAVNSKSWYETQIDGFYFDKEAPRAICLAYLPWKIEDNKYKAGR